MAWISFVPFLMSGIRPRLTPCVPWLSQMNETNLRTYVYDDLGRPGVWFYTLETDSTIAQKVARKLFHLNYNRASMKMIESQDKIDYSGTRWAGSCEYNKNFVKIKNSSQQLSYHCNIKLGSQFQTAKSNSLEYFILERYRLFSCTGESLYSGKVWHQPYKFASVEANKIQENYSDFYLVPINRYNPNFIAKKVDVVIFPLKRVSKS